MNYSLGEVQAIAKKAVRGVGYTWGMAEEAAKSVRFLCVNDIDGCFVLARYLNSVDKGAVKQQPPVKDAQTWSCRGGGSLCPIHCGAVLSDCAKSIDTLGVSIGPVAEPALLFHFGASVAQQLNVTDNNLLVEFEWAEGRCTMDGSQVQTTGSISEHTSSINVSLVSAAVLPRLKQTRAKPDPEAWQTLESFAQRTYAPATEESRLRGAGAGTTDND